MLPAIEQHVNWVAACMEYMRERNLDRIVPDVRAEDAWVAHVNSVAHQTLYPECNSWYLGANIPGKTRVFMPYVGYPAYVRRCQEVAYQGYEGFVLS